MRFTRPQIEDLRTWARAYYGGHLVMLTVYQPRQGTVSLSADINIDDNTELCVGVASRDRSKHSIYEEQGFLEVRIEGGKAVHVRRADSIDAGHALTDACWFPVPVLPTIDAGARALAMWEAT